MSSDNLGVATRLSEAPGNGHKSGVGQNLGGICEQLSVKGLSRREGPSIHQFLAREGRWEVPWFI